MWFVYILKYADGKLYTGCTENIEERIKRHTSGYVTATKLRLPVSLVAYIAFNDNTKHLNLKSISKADQEGLL